MKTTIVLWWKCCADFWHNTWRQGDSYVPSKVPPAEPHKLAISHVSVSSVIRNIISCWSWSTKWFGRKHCWDLNGQMLTYSFSYTFSNPFPCSCLYWRYAVCKTNTFTQTGSKKVWLVMHEVPPSSSSIFAWTFVISLQQTLSGSDSIGTQFSQEHLSIVKGMGKIHYHD